MNHRAKGEKKSIFKKSLSNAGSLRLSVEKEGRLPSLPSEIFEAGLAEPCGLSSV